MNIDESKTPEEPGSVVAVPNKGGRPSKYTPETVEKLLAAIADGLTIRQSCLAAGIGEQPLEIGRSVTRTWNRAWQRHAQARQKALACITTAGEAGHWRAAEATAMLFPAQRAIQWKKNSRKADIRSGK